MRRVVVYELLSLDGVAERPDEFFTEWDEVMDANLDAVIAAQDAVILGRTSYNEWAEFWPTATIEPFATFINGVSEYVATSTPLDRDWPNATAIDGDLVEFVRALKDQPGDDIGVHASISVAQSLLAGGVVDELRLVSRRRSSATADACSRACPPPGSRSCEPWVRRPATSWPITASASSSFAPCRHVRSTYSRARARRDRRGPNGGSAADRDHDRVDGERRTSRLRRCG